MPRLLGIVLLVVGVILVVYGVSASESIGDELSRAFRGTPTDRTIWLFIGGAAAAIVGLFLALLGRGATRV